MKIHREIQILVNFYHCVGVRGAWTNLKTQKSCLKTDRRRLKIEILNFVKPICTSLQVAVTKEKSHLRAASTRTDFRMDTFFNTRV